MQVVGDTRAETISAFPLVKAEPLLKPLLKRAGTHIPQVSVGPQWCQAPWQVLGMQERLGETFQVQDPAGQKHPGWG